MSAYDALRTVNYLRTIILVIPFIIGYSLYAQTLTTSNLPVVIIQTDINPANNRPREIADQFRVFGNMKIIYRKDGSRNYLIDSSNTSHVNYNNRISIEIRGQSSTVLDKKQYALTTYLEDNKTKNNVSILGMPSENDWILNGLAFDSTLMRDYLSYDMAQAMGNYSARSKYCEVMINGDYRGIYLFMEKLKIDKNRIDIEKLSPQQNSFPLITGGYITKCDKTDTADPAAWTFRTHQSGYVDFIHESPKATDITPSQHSYIKKEFEELIDLLEQKDASISTGYPTKIDIPSFVDFILLNEFASNPDGYQFSTYFHKDRNGKLRAGPIWDFNLTYGNDLLMWGFDRSKTNIWQHDDKNIGAKFWKYLFDDSTFRCIMANRWNELNQSGQAFHMDVIQKKIDSIGQLLAEARTREEMRWGTMNNYYSHIAQMKTWIAQRSKWMNDYFSQINSCTPPILPKVVISGINYHPYLPNFPNNDNLEFIALTNMDSKAVDLSGCYFRRLGINYIFPNGSIVKENETVYLASNSSAFELIYGKKAFDIFDRRLSNKSQALELADPFGHTIDFVHYQDRTPWPAEANGKGAYLQLKDNSLDNSLSSSWESAGINVVGETKTNILDGQLKIYPNPAESFVNVYHGSLKIHMVKVYSTLGNLVFDETANESSIQVDFTSIKKGSYILEVQLEGGIFLRQKVLKH